MFNAKHSQMDRSKMWMVYFLSGNIKAHEEHKSMNAWLG